MPQHILPPPTPRLRFREFSDPAVDPARAEADLDWMAELLGDPEVMTHYPTALDREGAAAWIARQLERYATDGHGLWIIEAMRGAASAEEQGSPEFLGDCGLTWQWTDRGYVLEVGYHLLPRHQGRGYATEAAAACRDLAAEALGADTLHAIVSRTNEPSHAVARRIGLIDERAFRGRLGQDLVLHSGPTRPTSPTGPTDPERADWNR